MIWVTCVDCVRIYDVWLVRIHHVSGWIRHTTSPERVSSWRRRARRRGQCFRVAVVAAWHNLAVLALPVGLRGSTTRYDRAIGIWSRTKTESRWSRFYCVTHATVKPRVYRYGRARNDAIHIGACRSGRTVSLVSRAQSLAGEKIQRSSSSLRRAHGTFGSRARGSVIVVGPRVSVVEIYLHGAQLRGLWVRVREAERRTEREREGERASERTYRESRERRK